MDLLPEALSDWLYGQPQPQKKMIEDGCLMINVK